MFEQQIAEQRASAERKTFGVFSRSTVRAAAVGAAIGFAVFVFLFVAVGRPDSYLEKIVVVIGGGAALGALVGALKRWPPAA